MRILVVAADKMEYAGVLANAGGVRKRSLKVDWAREGLLGGHGVLLVANGAGATRAAAAVDAACGQFRPDAVVSTGFCGALDPALTVASVIVATCVSAEDISYPALPVSSDYDFLAGSVLSVGHVVSAAEEKRVLRATGAHAVEMEAAGVARRARERGLAFYCIRGVTDLAEETMANDFNKALRPDGHFDTILVLAGALRNPAVRLPELIRLRSRCRRTARALGSFLANCRF